MEQNPPPLSSGAKPSWWRRNWKWFVPLGCFSIAVLFVVFVGSAILIVFSAVKSTEVYKDALARAKVHPAVIEALGSPITEGFLVSGNTNVNGASGEANLSIPIAGPKGNGTIYVASRKSLGQWELFGTRRRDRKNASTDRSSPEFDPAEFALISAVKTAINKLSVGAILFGILGGILGIAAGYQEQ